MFPDKRKFENRNYTDSKVTAKSMKYVPRKFPHIATVHQLHCQWSDSHNTAMHGLSKKITTATMELYHSVVKDLPPTPSKFHYIFNLRDLSRIYHGLCLTTPDRFDSVATFVRVWRNECMRVFFDRLTNDKDRDLVSVSD